MQLCELFGLIKLTFLRTQIKMIIICVKADHYRNMRQWNLIPQDNRTLNHTLHSNGTDHLLVKSTIDLASLL